MNENSEFKPAVPRLKDWPRDILFVLEGLGKYIHFFVLWLSSVLDFTTFTFIFGIHEFSYYIKNI